MQKPLISLIVAVYKNTDALRLIFSSLERQSYDNFEVIIAEDNNSPEMAHLIAVERQKGLFPLKHVSQDDCGFRKNKILNAAIREASGTFCTFIDGDCFPHKHFLKNISQRAKKHLVLAGRRVMLTKKVSKSLLSEKNFKGSINYLRLAFSGCKHAEKGLYLSFWKMSNPKKKILLGCNMTICKSDLIAINGFDETYIFPCIGEDIDIEWRLKMLGCEVKLMKYQGIVYHLWHKSNYTDKEISINHQILLQKQQKNDWQNRKNGLMSFNLEPQESPQA